MTGPVVLTANARLALFLQQADDARQVERGLKVWTAPDILPISVWLERSWRTWIHMTSAVNPVQLLSKAQEHAIWEGIVTGSHAGRELLQVAPTAEAAAIAWNLAHAWGIPFDVKDWENAKDSEAFRGWAGEFQRICEKRNWISAARLSDFIAAKIASAEIPVPPIVHLAGFTEFTPMHERLFDSMRQNCNIEILSVPDRGGRKSATRVGLIDPHHEIRTAARWARKQLEFARHSGERVPIIGIVVPELSKYRSVVERMFAEEFHPSSRLSPDQDVRRAFNISLGPALSEYPLIQAALRCIRMNPSATIYFDDVTILLRSPFLAKAQTEAAACAALDLQIRRRREPEMTLADISSLAPPGLKSTLAQWQLEYSRISGRQLPSKWCDAFSSELQSIGWPGERPLNSVEFQTTVAWRKLLAECAALDSVTGPLSRSSAVSMLQRLASNRQFQPESENSPVQILGVFEASGMSFDHLWVLGMHDGAWPRPVTPHPFLPLRLQRIHNLPHSSPGRELEFTTLLTDQLLASSPKVIVSYPSMDNDAALRPSPLFSGLPEIRIDDLELSSSPDQAELLFCSRNLEKIEDSNAPMWGGARIRGGTAIFTYQAACPFQAFAKIRLGADRLETPVTGLSPVDRGNLIHDVMAGVWKELGSHDTLVTESTESIREVVRDTVDSSIRKMAITKRALLDSRFASIEQSRLEKLVIDWLELEKVRQPFIVLPPEEKSQVNVGGIDLTIRADRMDRLENGMHVLIDYKTRGHSPKQWDGDRLVEPQIPLYAVTAVVPLAGVVFGVLKAGETRFTGLTSADGIVPGLKAAIGDDSLEKRIPQWRKVLEALATDFRSGKAAVDPKAPNQSCRICGLQGLCRIQESNPLNENDEEADSEVPHA